MGLDHDRKDALDEVQREILMEEVTHRVDEDHLWLTPFQRDRPGLPGVPFAPSIRVRCGWIVADAPSNSESHKPFVINKDGVFRRDSKRQVLISKGQVD